MKYILILFIGLYSCGDSAIEKRNKESIKNPEIILIDSCEYYVYWGKYEKHIVHKGNCNNCKNK